MKKLIFHAFVLVGSAMLFGGSAQAQYRVQIPFDFDAGNRHFAAGEYVVGPLDSNTSNSSLAIRDVETGKTRLAGITTLTGDGWEENPKLIFLKTGDNYTLAEIVTPRFAYKRLPAKRYSHVGAVSAVKSETVSIDLH